MTEGQEIAVQQLYDIASASHGSMEILNVSESEQLVCRVKVSLSLYCGNIHRKPDGIHLRERERFEILVFSDFPFEVPQIKTPHTRFAGFPHVQWGRSLCLYLAPNTEWDPNDGMFGFMTRLEEWLELAAINQLDPEGAPLHPPVAYHTGKWMLVIRENTPHVHDVPWFGTAQLKNVSDHRVDLVGWSLLFDENTPEYVGAVILLPDPLPFFEFPSKMDDLFTALESMGVSKETLLLTFQWAVIRNKEDTPLYVVIGSPMRGISGDDKVRRQHLTIWRIKPIIATGLRNSIYKHSEHEELRQIGEEIEKIILDWTKEAEIDWCKVEEQRDEIVTRRDSGSPVSWFANRTVSIWGCGALGGQIAEFLTRAGTKKIILRDNKDVTPGILVRQLYDDEDIGKLKVEALSTRLKRIRPEMEVEYVNENILSNLLSSKNWTEGAEIIIDATASRAVMEKVERCCHTYDPVSIPIASLVIDHHAQIGLTVLSKAEHSGGPLDVLRSTRMELIGRPEFKHFIEEFWPDTAKYRERIFQPEPGCSDTTFIGSAADTAILAGLMLNELAYELASETPYSGMACFVTQAIRNKLSKKHQFVRFQWKTDRIIPEEKYGYYIKITESAWDYLLTWISKSSHRNGSLTETGGLLFGERDDAAKVIWITKVSGPPLDSRASKYGFICGTYGTSEVSEKLKERSGGAIQFIGMWHSHPNGQPVPSDLDFEGMREIVKNNNSTPYNSPAKALLLIIGETVSQPIVKGYIFSRNEFFNQQLIHENMVSYDMSPVYNPIYRIFAKNWLSLGLSESVIYGDRSVELGYVIPVNIFWSEGHDLKYDDNILWAFDTEVRFWKGLTGYGELLLDELKMSKIGTDSWHNQAGYLGGVRWINPLGLSQHEWGIEYTRLRPFVYGHFFNINLPTHYGYSLGSTLPPNSDELRTSWKFFLRPDFTIDLFSIFRRHGTTFEGQDLVGGSIHEMAGGNLKIKEHYPFLDGKREDLQEIGVQGCFRVLERVELKALFGMGKYIDDRYQRFSFGLFWNY